MITQLKPNSYGYIAYNIGLVWVGVYDGLVCHSPDDDEYRCDHPEQ